MPNASRLPHSLPIRPRVPVSTSEHDFWAKRDDDKVRQSRHTPTAPPDGTTVDRYLPPWRSHLPHVGRRPPRKHIANFRGSIVDADGREIVLESTLELATARIALAHRGVRRLRSQVGPVPYVRDDGTPHRTIFDFVAEGDDQSLTIAVKPLRKRNSSGIDATLAAVREQRKDYAGELAVWTEEDVPRFAEHNAGLILRSRRLRNEHDVEAMKKVAASIKGVVVVAQFLSRSGPDARGLTAAINLIDDGVLIPVEAGRIGPALRVRYAS